MRFRYLSLSLQLSGMDESIDETIDRAIEIRNLRVH
jgi:hypothetical protein